MFPFESVSRARGDAARVPAPGVDRRAAANHAIRVAIRVLLGAALAAPAVTSPRADDARAALSEALDRLEATVSGTAPPAPSLPAPAPAETQAAPVPEDGLGAALAATRLAPGESLALDVTTAWPSAWIYVDVLTPEGKAVHGGRPRRLPAHRTATIRIGTTASGPDASVPGVYHLVVLALDGPLNELAAAPATEPAADAVARLRRATALAGGVGPQKLALRILPFELCRC